MPQLVDRDDTRQRQLLPLGQLRLDALRQVGREWYVRAADLILLRACRVWSAERWGCGWQRGHLTWAMSCARSLR